MHIKSDTPTLEILKLNSADQFGCVKQFMEKDEKMDVNNILPEIIARYLLLFCFFTFRGRRKTIQASSF